MIIPSIKKTITSRIFSGESREKMADETKNVNLPIIDLIDPDRNSTAASIRQLRMHMLLLIKVADDRSTTMPKKACIEFGFFYIVNHGVENIMFVRLFEESKKFFSLPMEEKMKLAKRDYSGYSAMYAEKLDPTSTIKGDSKESFYVGPLDAEVCNLNQWPCKELLPVWKPTIETYHRKLKAAGTNLLSLFALALDLDEMYFIRAMDSPMAILRLLYYPGDLSDSKEETLGASAHSDYGMMALVASDGVPGLQVCRDKDHKTQVWEDVPHIEGALIVNVGDMMERWTNGLFRSTLHRVKPKGKERYSAAFFFDPPTDFVVECLESCCSESNPPRYPPIRAGDYYTERFRLAYGN